MANIEGIFSLRLVIADFYMDKPTLGLDPCYSEFRGKEIKRVPIIRIFGSNGNGQKTCMHIHGVFPYFYIPFERKDFESLNQAFYQIAINVDKAINISLGQASSGAQHVFKVQLVKGIPFYGYHRTEHQFLKIYMFNPRFVRRAANLLQNGTILGKVFHPHESHVPYILQFMIDFNLYGMSLLHVPLEIVKFRRTNQEEDINYTGVHSGQILSITLAKKQSSSTLEIDISANFILNRFQLVTKSSSLHSNPGIESIWRDEQVRRKKLVLSVADDVDEKFQVPPLEVPATQERPGVQSTESELFYRSALLSKLQTIEASCLLNSEQDTNITVQTNATNIDFANITNLSNKEQKRTFNLKKILANAVYPEECTQDDILTNASFVENHLSNEHVFQTSIRDKKPSHSNANGVGDVFLNDTVVDEELVLSLTQQHVPLNASLREEDFQLLDVLEQLEEVNMNGDHIDLDSSLAPLTQNDNNCAASLVANLSDDKDSESENQYDENLHDFTIVMDDIDELLTKLTQTQPTATTTLTTNECVPQIDGSDDALRSPSKSMIKKNQTLSTTKLQKTPPRTPNRASSKRRRQSVSSPARSPRTAKSTASAKYAPLPIFITNKSQRDLNNTRTVESPIFRSTTRKNSSNSMHKQVALHELRRKSISIAQNSMSDGEMIPPPTTVTENIKKSKRRSERIKDLDKTHVTCALTPSRSTERKLKVYKIENREKILEIPSFKEVQREGRDSEIILENGISNLNAAVMKRSTEKTAEKEKSQLKHGQHKEFLKLNKPEIETKETNGEEIIMGDSSVSSSVKINYNIIEKNNFTDEEEIIGSDTELNGSVKMSRKASNLRTLRRSLRGIKSQNDHELRNTIKLDNQVATPTTIHGGDLFQENRICREDSEQFQDLHVQNPVYYKSTVLNSPSMFSEPSVPSPILPSTAHSLTIATPLSTDSISPITTSSSPVIVTPLDLPPTYAEVLDGCRKFDIPAHEFQQPFYSNPADATEKKEIGATVLSIPCNKLNDCTEFQSVLGTELKGINQWRQQQLLRIGGPAMLTRYRNSQKVREYCASECVRVYITPQMIAPTKYEAMLWVKARELMSSDKSNLKPCTADDDSPIKITRKKVTMMLQNDGDDATDDVDAEMDCSVCSLTLTPMTPGSIYNSQADGRNADNSSCNSEKPSTEIHLKDGLVVPTKRRRARKSLLNKLRDSLERNPDHSQESEDSLLEVPKSVFTENILKSGDCLDDINEKMSRENHKDSQSSSKSYSITSPEIRVQLERSSFMKNLKLTKELQHEISFGLSSASLNNTFGFKVNLENLQEAKADIEFSYLTTIMLEVFVSTRGELYPDPAFDGIRCIFYAIENSIPGQDTGDVPDGKKLTAKSCGYIIVNDFNDIINEKEGKRHGIDGDVKVQVVETEAQAMQALIDLCTLWDPDIYAGYEIEMASWGYVMERAKFFNLNMSAMLSRIPTQKVRDFVDEDRDQFTDLDIEMKLCGRILLDVWRLMRSEIALTSYTFENVMYHIMHRRCPWHSYRELTSWFGSPCSRWIVIEYYLERVRGTLALLDQLDLIGRTSEMAKLIGIQFYEVLSRGSQFRVESMMLRIAKPKNLVPLSPSVQQRAHMRAPEYLALIMEPLSRFYADPVIVLDFQSLYPSMIIAYNYCFSTCLGRVEHLGQSSAFEFGTSQLRVSPTMLRRLLDEDLLTISPCGVVFVKPEIREGILPRMLTEILDTRQMVKQSMKLHKSNTALQRILHSRQLGLKLMANVTYGYTAANFSGRMPSVEVGDSVVSKGRETLERAIKLVEANERWNVRVVYGDTDSMFVQVPGRTRAKAFEIGSEIAEAVTKINPHPVKLKLEKVYQPCILQTKKRYVGYMYETPDQNEPIYEAKGIETVRRDGCPATAKLLEKVLRILFETADVSQVKNYVCRQFTKILSGRANLQDLIFAKEFRGLNGYKPTACVPALEITRKWIQTDPRRIPRRGERVPFIIINGPPGLPLIRLVRTPHQVLADEGLKINAIYYITKAIIPPLNRCLLLIGADVNEWFTKLPRKILALPTLSSSNEVIPSAMMSLQTKKSTISQYFSATNCLIDCGRHTKNGICSVCEQDATKSCVVLYNKSWKIERGFHLTQQICQACCGRVGDIKCGSLDCPVLYILEVKRRELQQIVHFQNLLEEKF